MRLTPRVVLALGGFLFFACGADERGPLESAPEPVRVRLFDHMDDAALTGPGAGTVASSPTETLRIDFDERSPERVWLGRSVGRRLSWEEGDDGVRLDPVGGRNAGGGRDGGGLVVGPGVAAGSRAVFVVPASPLARVRVSGRVRLEGNPMVNESSSREVLRVVEQDDAATVAPRLPKFARSSSGISHRVARSIDPSGWDRFETTFVSRVDTQSLLLVMLHPAAVEDTVTRFDDLEIEVTPLSAGELYEGIRTSHRPRDGGEQDTPWRLRVELPSSAGGGGRRGGKAEARDCVLLPPPGELVIAVDIPAAETGPVLRFAYGMPREAQRMPGDGARIAVSFRGPDGEVLLETLELDPKNDRDHRRWMHARIDLGPVAGGDGYLIFATSDVDDETDPFDAVLIATPRIEPSQATERTQGALNVLLIGIDTLRPDRMSVFGYERPTTPNLERLAEQGVRFTHARSQAPWTLPSFASIMTSLYPSSHGAGRGGHDEWTPIDPTTTALAEVLARVGYRTQGIVANGLISPQYGLDQGFDAYRWGWGFEAAHDDAAEVAEFVAENAHSPWFVFWHIMDPHLPYTSEDDYHNRFTDGEYAGRFDNGQVPFQVLDPRPGRRWFTHEGPPPPPELDEDDRRYVNDAYDAEIAETDAAIGRVLTALEASGQWDRTIVALIADHGEGLGDHDHYHHGYTLFEDQVRVPMLLRVPGGPTGRSVERSVASIDLAPTILAALGLEAPEAFRGVDRLAPGDGEDHPYYIEYPTYDSSAQKAWILGDFKYVHDPVFHTEALYDLAADPTERADVTADHPAIVARARADLDRFRWNELQKGRFHLRVRADAGTRLLMRAAIDDLFDANFVCDPLLPEQDFTLDLERKLLTLDTTLGEDHLELVFWGRGNVLDLALELDGRPVAIALAGDPDPAPSPARFATADLPEALGAELAWPRPGQALLWLEAGAHQVLPVVPTPEEMEHLRQLGYAR